MLAGNGPKKLSNHPSWLIFFSVVSFNKIALFSKELITFITSLISLFAGVIPATLFSSG